MDRFNIMSRAEYKDVQEDKGDIILLGLAGSHSYGTNVEGSDIDIRGIRYNELDMLLGLKEPSQYTAPDTDSTIFDLNKAIPLLAKCNPNMIEMLGLEEEDYILLDNDGRDLIDNADMFLSQDCVKNAFGGYARAQLKRLQNGLKSDGHSVKKDDNHLSKHAMHLVRLLLMGTEILRTGQIHTRRKGEELALLKEIRAGQYLKAGQMDYKFYELTTKLEYDFNMAYTNSQLPDKPDWDRINRFLFQVNYETIMRKV